MFQRPGYAPRIFVADPAISTRYSNWITSAVIDTLTVKPGNFLVSSDTSKIGFKGKGFSIPLQLAVHYEFKKYRIGAGYSFEFLSMGDFKPISYEDKISTFRLAQRTGLMRKFYGIAGMSFYRWDDILFTGDLQVGAYKPGKNFDLSLIKKGVYVNIGVTAEKELSEYLRVFIRPAYEIKKYTLSIPETGKNINHKFNSLYLSVGLTYSIPELPRCYNKDCHIQINHAHGDREYRSRMHKIWKWQNPHYGQNNPKLIKYKGKNRKKLNPY